MSSKKIVLNSSDGETFEIDEAVARKMQTIAHMIDDECADKPIPLENITGKILALVIEYCKKHVDVYDDIDSIKALIQNLRNLKANIFWVAEFMSNFDTGTVFKLMIAANYLNIKGLRELTCNTLADNPSEELAKVREENAWAFEDI